MKVMSSVGFLLYQLQPTHRARAQRESAAAGEKRRASGLGESQPSRERERRVATHTMSGYPVRLRPHAYTHIAQPAPMAAYSGTICAVAAQSQPDIDI